MLYTTNTVYCIQRKKINLAKEQRQLVYPYFQQSPILIIQGKTTLSTLEKESDGMSLKQHIVKYELKVHISVLHVKMITIMIMETLTSFIGEKVATLVYQTSLL